MRLCLFQTIVLVMLVIGKSLLWPGASQWRIYYHRMWGQLSTTCSNVLIEAAQLGTPSFSQPQPATDNGVRETVDRIDWSYPPPSWAVPPAHSINHCNLSVTRTCNRSMRGNHLAYAATQGIMCAQLSVLWSLFIPDSCTSHTSVLN